MKKYYTGALKSPKDIRDYRVCKTAKVELPEEFELQVSEVLDQGSVNSCVGHALATAIKSISNDSESVMWLYGYREDGNTSEGMSIVTAIKTARNLGCVKRADFDGNKEMTEAYELVNANIDRLKALASEFKINSYARLFSEEDVKLALLKGIPVVSGITVYKDYLATDKKGVVKAPKGDLIGGHAIVVYGWNKQGWLIQNSWGKEWGNGGRAILPYSYGLDESYAISKSDVSSENPEIIKPNFYWLREIIMFFVKLIRKLLNRK